GRPPNSVAPVAAPARSAVRSMRRPMPVKTVERRPRAPASAAQRQVVSAPAPQERILALQRSAGNAAVGRVLQRDWYDYIPSPLNPLGVVGELTGIRFPSIGSVTAPPAGPFRVDIHTNRARAHR